MSQAESAAWLGPPKAKSPKISELDSALYIGKVEAAKLLKVHPRQLERRAQQGRIEKHYLPRKPGEKAARVVYSRADIEALLSGIESEFDESELPLNRQESSEVRVLPHPSAWPSQTEAAVQLGTNERTIRRYIASGRLRSAKRPVVGAKPQTVIHPDDIARVRQEQEREPARMELELPRIEPAASALAELFAGAARALADAKAKPVPTLFLNLDQAAEASGLPRRLLLKLIHTPGYLKAAHHSGEWYVRRADLEALELP